MPALTGSIADPEFRRRRAVHAAKARTSVDHHVKQIVDRAPELTDQQRSQLAVILRASSSEDVSA